MLKFSKLSVDATVDTAVANFGGAMEADTISKHGQSLKSQMSRENILRRASVFLLVAAMFAGCSKDDTRKVKSITATPTSISIFYDEKSEIKMAHFPLSAKEPVYTFVSDDEYVAAVDNAGKVSGRHVGECIIEISTSVGVSTQCNVTIKPRSNLYKEPYLVFGGSVSSVKAYENRSIASETSTGIVYRGENSNIRNVVYLFEGGKMTAAAVLFANTTYCVDEAHKYLSERYDPLGSSGNIIVYQGRGRVIGFSLDNDLGLNALYIPDTDTKSHTASRFDAVKERLLSIIANNEQ